MSIELTGREGCPHIGASATSLVLDKVLDSLDESRANLEEVQNIKNDTAKIKDMAESAKDDAVNAKNDAETASRSAQEAEHEAKTAKDNAERANSDAQEAKADAESARNDAATAKTAAEAAKDEAVKAKNDAETLKAETANLKADAVVAKTAAELAQAEAELALERATGAKNAAETAATAAVSAKDDAVTAKAEAESAKADATRSKEAAEAAKNDAVTARDEACAAMNTAKQYSGKPPLPVDGTWQIWNAETEEYEDSGASSVLSIQHSYPSITAMNADFANTSKNDMAMISASVEEEDTAKLYINNGTEWIYLCDLSGVQGAKGDAATVRVGSVTVGEAGSEPSIENVGTSTAAILDFVIPKGDKGDPGDSIKGDTGNGIASIVLSDGNHTPGTVDTYTVTFTNGESFPFQVYNGANGEGAGDFMSDGSVPMTGDLDAGGNKVTNLAAPEADTDAVRKGDLAQLITAGPAELADELEPGGLLFVTDQPNGALNDEWAQDSATVKGTGAICQIEDNHLHLKAGSGNGNNSAVGASDPPAVFVDETVSAALSEVEGRKFLEMTFTPLTAKTGSRFGIYLNYTDPGNGFFIGFDPGGWYWQMYSSGDGSWYNGSRTPSPDANEQTTLQLEWEGTTLLSATVNGTVIFAGLDFSAASVATPDRVGLKLGAYGGVQTEVEVSRFGLRQTSDRIMVKNQDGSNTEVLLSGGSGGQSGKSAYEQAVEGGYTGTEEEFNQILASGPWLPLSGGTTKGETNLAGGLILPYYFSWPTDWGKPIEFNLSGGTDMALRLPAYDYDTKEVVYSFLNLSPRKENNGFFTAISGIAPPRYDNDVANKKYVDDTNKIPDDTLVCTIHVQSYGYQTGDFYYNEKTPVLVHKKVLDPGGINLVTLHIDYTVCVLPGAYWPSDVIVTINPPKGYAFTGFESSFDYLKPNLYGLGIDGGQAGLDFMPDGSCVLSAGGRSGGTNDPCRILGDIVMEIA